MTWFDSYGWIQKRIPKECVDDCSRPGDCEPAVKYWQRELNFNAPREIAIPFLKKYGAWELDELNALDDDAISQKILWLACGDIAEQGEWFGMV